MAKVNLGWREFVTEFQGSEVSMELRPLKSGPLLEITDLFERFGEGVVSLTGQLNIQKAYAALHGEHVRNLKGIEDDSGVAIEPQNIGEEASFIGLAMYIVYELLKISNLMAGESKNSGAPAGSTSKTGSETAGA